MTFRHLIVIFSLIFIATSTAACQSKRGADTASGLKRVHFDEDSATLRPAMVTVMDNNARYLKKHTKLNIVVEGHCDERGTNEYNLALGDRRADGARDYLVRQGVPAKRLTTVSFGEERPIENGHNESAWYTNRRAEFIRQ